MREIEFWDSCSARALARRERRALQGALHGGVAVAAVGAVLETAVARGSAGRLQREATGGGGGRPRRVGASARWSNGWESREGVGGEKQSREVEMEIRIDLQFPKIPGTPL